jgi:general secretion pathway protein D
MYFFNRLTAVVAITAMLGPMLPLEARTRKGDKLLAEGRSHEARKEWDQALDAYEKAFAEDPSDIVYQMAEDKARFQTAQSHIDKGTKLRNRGVLGEALLEFQRAYAINPSSAAAEQDIRRTREMIEVERKKVQESGKESLPEERALTPGERAKKESNERIDRILPVPDLKPLNPDPIRLKMSGQPKLLFETVAKLAGLNVLWDPEYQAPVRTNVPVEFDNSTLEEALDYLAVITKSYWKPLSPNTIFITMDNPNKRRDYEEQVAKVFYLSNVNTPQELQEIVNAVRSVADIQRFFPYNSQNAIIAKGSADQIALAEKILHDLDKPKSEVVVDIIVMEASTVYTRQLTAALASTGLNMPVSFTPRSIIQSVTTGTGTATTATGTTSTGTTATGTGTTGTGTTDTGTTSTTTTTGGSIPLTNLGKVNGNDWSTILPGAVLQAVLSDANTKVLQSPQIRTVDNIKATLKIGDRVPTASGSFQPGIGGVGINPLVNTQFTYIDTGVNVDLLARVHDNGDVSLEVDLDINSVNGHVNLGGIDQPIIGQRKVSHKVRMREGEVNLLGGLTKYSDSKTKTGIPGLGSIPLLGRLFSGESVDRERSELMIALIPHVVRRPEFTEENLRGIAVGNQASVHLNYSRKPSEGPAAAPKKEEPPAAALPPAAENAAPAQPANGPPVTAQSASGPPATAPVAPGIPQPGIPQPGMPPATAPPLTDAAKPADKPSVPGGNVSVHFLPEQTVTSVQGVVTVALVIENGSDVASSPLQFRFDPKVVKVNDVGRGDFFSGDGQVPVFTKNIQNDAGAAFINLNRLPGTAGANGSGVLATINFQGVSPGTTTISVANLSVRNTQGQVVATGTPTLTVTVK